MTEPFEHDTDKQTFEVDAVKMSQKSDEKDEKQTPTALLTKES